MLREVVVLGAEAEVARVAVPVPAPLQGRVPAVRDLRPAQVPEWAHHRAAPIRGRRLLQGWGRMAPPPGPTSTPTRTRAIRTFSRQPRTARRQQRRKLRGTLVPAMPPTGCRSAARAAGPAMKIRNNPVPVQDRPAPCGPICCLACGNRRPGRGRPRRRGSRRRHS